MEPRRPRVSSLSYLRVTTENITCSPVPLSLLERPSPFPQHNLSSSLNLGFEDSSPERRENFYRLLKGTEKVAYIGEDTFSSGGRSKGASGFRTQTPAHPGPAPWGPWTRPQMRLAQTGLRTCGLVARLGRSRIPNPRPLRRVHPIGVDSQKPRPMTRKGRPSWPYPLRKHKSRRN